MVVANKLRKALSRDNDIVLVDRKKSSLQSLPALGNGLLEGPTTDPKTALSSAKEGNQVSQL